MSTIVAPTDSGMTPVAPRGTDGTTGGVRGVRTRPNPVSRIGAFGASGPAQIRSVGSKRSGETHVKEAVFDRILQAFVQPHLRPVVGAVGVGNLPEAVHEDRVEEPSVVPALRAGEDDQPDPVGTVFYAFAVRTHVRVGHYNLLRAEVTRIYGFGHRVVRAELEGVVGNRNVENPSLAHATMTVRDLGYRWGW